MHTFRFSTVIDWLTVLPAYLEYAIAHSHTELSTSLLFLRCGLGRLNNGLAA
jgi:hypothetical protein